MFDDLLQETECPEITKIIALKDIRFSNSAVEAINKIVKRYLRHYEPKTEPAVQKILEQVLHDYNELRPHGSLNGLIPMEAYTRPDKKLSYEKEKKRAKALRIAENRRANCMECLK